jgi:hypothetical protein
MKGKDHQRDLTENWKRMYTNWMLRKDNGVAQPKHESLSSDKEYETFDFESRSTRLQKKCTFKELKAVFSYKLIIGNKTSLLETAINIRTNPSNFEGVLD